jgi:NAD(P)-dependent dehydrogenase (short-subunit alcohol dehydrogenase family)
MARVLIVGASRGIGLELARQYAESGAAVIAAVRNIEAQSAVAELAKAHPNLRVIALDISSQASIEAAGASLVEPLDEIIVVAGVSGGPRQSVDDIDLEEWRRTFEVNTIGPFLVARAFKKNLLASGAGRLMFLTSQLAASTWPLGGRYAYAPSKAALNKLAQTLAIDWKEDPITIALMHPGWVQTDMGGPKATLPVAESAVGIRKVMGSLTKADSGKFYKWNGEIHPW